MNNSFIDDLSAKLKELAQNGPAHDIERNMKAVLSSMFARMDLVTREEFDVQSAVLARTREKLNKLETQLAELEKKTQSGT